jgi:hypothetical protein
LGLQLRVVQQLSEYLEAEDTTVRVLIAFKFGDHFPHILQYVLVQEVIRFSPGHILRPLILLLANI